jgi:G3E family GTPase
LARRCWPPVCRNPTRASDGVVNLANGCICCSLEGDLLRTLATILRRDPRPDSIVIETSGIADPADIVRNLMDPMVWREAPLETMLCVVDATGADALNDTLLRAQVRAADIVALSRVDSANLAEIDRGRAALALINPKAVVVETVQGQVPLELLFPAVPESPRALRDPRRPRPISDRFDATTWTSDRPISLPRLQAAVGRLAPRLARAKGLFEAVEHPGRQLLLQFAGGRATIAPAGTPVAEMPRVRIVFIAEIGALSSADICQVMEQCIPL